MFWKTEEKIGQKKSFFPDFSGKKAKKTCISAFFLMNIPYFPQKYNN